MRQILTSFFFSLLCCRWLPHKPTINVPADRRSAAEPAEDATQLQANAEAVFKMGENGLVEMATRLDTPGDPTRLHYAINGFSFAASQPGKESWREMAVKAYGRTLGKLSDKEAQLFIITQLEHVGKDDAISYLKAYLHDDRLSDAASRALATINTDASKNALLQALPDASGNARLSLVQALGDTRFAPAVPPYLSC